MITDPQPGGGPARSQAPGGARPRPRLEVSALLELCDRLLDEVGRRRHLFGWLRNGEEWIPVDSYYPRHRLVVMRTSEGLDPELFSEHRLRLLALDPGELGPDPARAEHLLAMKLADLAPALPPEPPEQAAPRAAVALNLASRLRGRRRRAPLHPAADRGARFLAAHRRQASFASRHAGAVLPPRPSGQVVFMRIMFGVVWISALAVSIFLLERAAG